MVTDDAAPLLSSRGAVLGDVQLHGASHSEADASLSLDITLGRSPQYRPLFFAATHGAAGGGGHNIRAWVSRSLPTSCPPSASLHAPSAPLAFAANCSARSHTLRLPLPPGAFECLAGGGPGGGGADADVHTVFFLTLRVDAAEQPCAPPSLAAHAGPVHDAVSPGCTFITVRATCRHRACRAPAGGGGAARGRGQAAARATSGHSLAARAYGGGAGQAAPPQTERIAAQSSGGGQEEHGALEGEEGGGGWAGDGESRSRGRQRGAGPRAGAEQPPPDDAAAAAGAASPGHTAVPLGWVERDTKCVKLPTPPPAAAAQRRRRRAPDPWVGGSWAARLRAAAAVLAAIGALPWRALAAEAAAAVLAAVAAGLVVGCVLKRRSVQQQQQQRACHRRRAAAAAEAEAEARVAEAAAAAAHRALM